jgi:hypothetical protein
MKKIFKNNSGQTMLITLLILSAAFLIAMALGGLVLYELKSSIYTGESIKAYYAAESAVEWELFQHIKSGENDFPIMNNDTSIESYSAVTTTEGLTITAVGKSGVTYRALQVTY